MGSRTTGKVRPISELADEFIEDYERRFRVSFRYTDRFRQNITVTILPIFSRRSTSVCIRVHPWPNRSFSLAFGQLSKFGFRPWMDTDRMLGFTETMY